MGWIGDPVGRGRGRCRAAAGPSTSRRLRRALTVACGGGAERWLSANETGTWPASGGCIARYVASWWLAATVPSPGGQTIRPRVRNVGSQPPDSCRERGQRRDRPERPGPNGPRNVVLGLVCEDRHGGAMTAVKHQWSAGAGGAPRKGERDHGPSYAQAGARRDRRRPVVLPRQPMGRAARGHRPRHRAVGLLGLVPGPARGPVPGAQRAGRRDHRDRGPGLHPVPVRQLAGGPVLAAHPAVPGVLLDRGRLAQADRRRLDRRWRLGAGRLLDQRGQDPGRGPGPAAHHLRVVPRLHQLPAGRAPRGLVRAGSSPSASWRSGWACCSAR